MLVETRGRNAQGAAADEALRRALSAPRLVIERPSPCVDDGRFPSRAVVGQALSIEADVYADGHEQLAAEVLWQAPGTSEWQRVPMQELGNDRWRAVVRPEACGLHRYTFEGWIDLWGGYVRDLRKLQAAGVVSALDVREGVDRVRAAAASHPQHAALHALAEKLRSLPQDAALAQLLDARTAQLMVAAEPRRFLRRREPALSIDVERRAAGFASWYELFPRSQGHDGRHGTFDDVVSQLPMIAAMGFDVLYMPPIHPIGTTKRKGRNNSLKALPGEPGSPYAIGSADGGHDAVHPELGGIEAFRRLRDAAAGYGIELALDFAVQCSPDHPWLQQHPEWFNWRADGSIRCAENPPKKYEDIVNVDFYAASGASPGDLPFFSDGRDADGAQPSLWLALRDVVEYWVGEGVRAFRVDNPHTKPLPFWQWLIADIRSRHPDVTFLSEAFTRPAMMYRLAKIGFSQSYTYFTWRNTRAELESYLTELNAQAPRDFFRPHFFVNTPDINPTFLHHSGRPGFVIRAALATTLSGLWGLYGGFEFCESAPLPGKEEYLDSEKYQLRARDWTRPGNIIPEITRLNHLRRDYAALQTHLGFRVRGCDNPQVICYSKRAEGEDQLLLIAVSLDPHAIQECHVEVPLAELGADAQGLEVEELMTGQHLRWRDARQHWRFIPQELPFAIWRLRRAGGGEH
jgi:starch synthase (maltosyl-transferring)